MTRFIEKWRATAGVEFTCATIGCPVSTYYERRNREPCLRELQDRVLLLKIHEARAGYGRVYGVRKTWRKLLRMGIDVGRDRVARLMRREGLVGCLRGKKRTTTPDETAADRARDLVQRRFEATEPNQLWVADFTYVRTFQGFAYVAFILDVHSRMIVGWQIATHMRAELVLDALEMANALRQPAPGLVAHSDRGSQYTSLVYTERLEEIEASPSVGSRGDAYDNAMAEAWVGTYKAELVDWLGRTSYQQLEQETMAWISFYNHERLHESLGDVPPAEFEATGSPQSPAKPAAEPPTSPRESFRRTVRRQTKSIRKDLQPLHGNP